MTQQYQGKIRDPGGRFAIVVSRWNAPITEALLRGAREAFAEEGVGLERLDIAWVPGALELPLAAQRLLATGRYRALLALGCVVKGESAHFEVVVKESCRHLSALSLKYDRPVLLGVLTTYTLEQARARSGPDKRNKGREVARAALEMVQLLESLPGPS